MSPVPTRWMLFALPLTLIGCGHEARPVAPDLTPPPPIEVVRAVAVSDSSVRLFWNLPTSERPSQYEMRYCTDPLALATEGGWQASAKVTFRGDDGVTSFVVSDLDEATTYYFAIRAYDAAGNHSSTSTIARATTDEKPPQFQMMWGARGSGPGEFMNPTAIAYGSGGYGLLYVADTGNNRIQSFHSTDGSFLNQWGSYCNLATGEGCVDPDGSGPLELGDGQFGLIHGIATDASGNVYVADWMNRRILKFTPEGVFISKWSIIAQDIDVDPDGTIYALVGGHYVYAYSLNGVLLRIIEFVDHTNTLATDGRGDIYMDVFGQYGRVMKFSTHGALLTSWGSHEQTCDRGQLYEPARMGIDILGNVYVPGGCSRVQKFDSQGRFLTAWGTRGTGPGEFGLAQDVVVADTRIFVLDASDPTDPLQTSRIQVFTSDHSYPRVGKPMAGLRRKDAPGGPVVAR